MRFLQQLPPSVVLFLKRQTGVSLYEYALLASLIAVVGIIVLIALAATG
jgi:Flp pilus assembly pilin Flp